MSTAIKLAGISPGAVAAAQIRRVDAREAKELCGDGRAGLWIPYFDREGKPVFVKGKPFGRLRLDEATGGQKYSQEAGTGVQLYTPPQLQQIASDGTLLITEGEKKALSLCDLHLPAVGLGGICSWSVKVDDKRELIPALRQIMAARKVEKILFVGDSDTAFIHDFAREAVALRKAAGVPVELPRIDVNMPKGVDDVRAGMGDAEFLPWWKAAQASAIKVSQKLSVDDLAQVLACEQSANVAKLDSVEKMEVFGRVVKMLAAMTGKANVEAVARALAKPLGTSTRALIGQAQDRKAEAIERRKTELMKPQSDREHWGPMWERVTSNKEGITDAIPSERFFAYSYAEDDTILYEPSEGRFYQYDAESGAWIEQTEGAMLNRVGGYLLAKLQSLKDSGMSGDLVEFGIRHTEASRMTAMLKQLSGITERKDVFTSRKSFIHCKTMMVGFEGSEIVQYDFDPEFYSRNPLPYDPDFSAPPERFLSELLLPAVHEDDIDLFQKFAGSWILQDNPAQKFLILTGRAGRGKSTLVRIMENLVGRHNCTQLRTGHLDDRFEIGRMLGKTLLTAPDVKGDFLQSQAVGQIKSLVGGDPLHAELKNANGSFQLDGRFNVVMTCNERLRVRLDGDADAWQRRMAIIQFEAPPPKRVVADLADELLRTEGPRILAWCIQGAQRLIAELSEYGKMQMTDRQAQVVSDLLAESRSLEIFIQSNCRRAEGWDVTTGELSEKYGDFCAARGWSALPQHTIQRQSIDLMLRYHSAAQSNSVKRDNRSNRGWRGVRMEVSA